MLAEVEGVVLGGALAIVGVWDLNTYPTPLTHESHDPSSSTVVRCSNDMMGGDVAISVALRLDTSACAARCERQWRQWPWTISREMDLRWGAKGKGEEMVACM